MIDVLLAILAVYLGICVLSIFFAVLGHICAGIRGEG